MRDACVCGKRLLGRQSSDHLNHERLASSRRQCNKNRASLNSLQDASHFVWNWFALAPRSPGLTAGTAWGDPIGNRGMLAHLDLFPGPHVNFGLVFIGRLEGCQDKIKDSKNEAD